MVESALRQQLSHLLSQYGEVETLQYFPQTHDGAIIILATMKTPEEATSAQQALGLPLFGFNSLIINESWVKAHCQDK